MFTEINEQNLAESWVFAKELNVYDF